MKGSLLSVFGLPEPRWEDGKFFCGVIMTLQNKAEERITISPPQVGIGFGPFYFGSKDKSYEVSKYSPNSTFELENNGVWRS